MEKLSLTELFNLYIKTVKEVGLANNTSDSDLILELSKEINHLDSYKERREKIKELILRFNSLKNINKKLICEHCGSNNCKKSFAYPSDYFCKDCKNGGKIKNIS